MSIGTSLVQLLTDLASAAFGVIGIAAGINGVYTKLKGRDHWWLSRFLPRSGIKRPIGHGWTIVFRTFLPKKQFDRYFGQAIVDARMEEAEALAQGDKAEARRIRWVLHASLLKVILSVVCEWPFALLASAVKGVLSKDE